MKIVGLVKRRSLGPLACLGLALLVVALTVLADSGFAGQARTEAPPVLTARELAPTELLGGPDFEVDSTVPTDGFYGMFTVRGGYGSIQARGVTMLRIRVAETQALARLEEVSRREAVVGGARESVQKTVQAAGQTVQNPAEAVERLPGSVGRLFSRVGGRVEKRFEGATSSGDGMAPAGERPGLAEARRSLARQLGVDPYTDNPLLSRKLDEVARWKRMGAIAVGVATGGASMWAGIATKTAQLVWTTPPEEVQAANEKRLSILAPGASAEDIRRFLHNPAFTPTTQTLLVDRLEAFSVAKGRDSVVTIAGGMESQDQARFLIEAVGLLSTYHERVAPLSSVETRDRLPVGLTASGSLILPAPVDCLAWTDRLVGLGNRADLRAPRREILITGKATLLTYKQLSTRGWVVREHFL